MDMSEHILKKSSYYDHQLKSHKDFMDSVMKKYSLKNSSIIKNSRIEKSREKYLLHRNDSKVTSSHHKYDSRLDEIIQRTLRKIERGEKSTEEFSRAEKKEEFYDKEVERIMQKFRANEIVREIEQNNAPRTKLETGVQAPNVLSTHAKIINDELTNIETAKRECQVEVSHDDGSFEATTKMLSPRTSPNKVGLKNKSLDKFREFYNANRRSKPTIPTILAKRLTETNKKEKPNELQNDSSTVKNIQPSLIDEETSYNRSAYGNKPSVSPIRKSMTGKPFADIEDSIMSNIDFEYSQLDQSLPPDIAEARESMEVTPNMGQRAIGKGGSLHGKSKTEGQEISTLAFDKKLKIIARLKKIEERVF